MKLGVFCEANNNDIFSLESGNYKFDNLYGEGPIEMILENGKLKFEEDIVLSDAAMEAMISANVSMGNDMNGETISTWCKSVYKGKIKKELFNKFGCFFKKVERLVSEIRSVFYITFKDLKLNDQIFVIDDDGKVIPTHIVLDGDCNITTTIIINNKSLNEFVDEINKSHYHLYAFSILLGSVRQSDFKLRTIELAMAAELGIKEFYSRKIPQLKKILDSISSPPIEKLYGSIYTDYFGEDFPYRNKIAILLKKRNDIIHSNKTTSISMSDAVEYTKTVQKSLALLQSKIFDYESSFMKNFKEIGEFQDQGANRAQILFTDDQVKRIEEDTATFIGMIQMKSRFSSQ